MVEYLLIIISAIFVNNILLSQFLGICPFLGVSNKLSTAAGMSMAVCFVITLATVVTFLLNKLLVMCGLEFLQTISFILVIAALVQMVEIVLKKISPALYASLGIFLPLITTNCAVLGVALTVVQKPSGFAAAADGMMNLGYNIKTGASDLHIKLPIIKGKQIGICLLLWHDGKTASFQPSNLYRFAKEIEESSEVIDKFLESIKAFLSTRQRNKTPYEPLNGYYYIDFKTLVDHKDEILGIFSDLLNSLR